MMWFLLLLLYTAHIEQVIGKGEDRLILKNGSNPCEGLIEIYHNDTLGYIGEKYWNGSSEEVVCRSINCGEPVTSSTETALHPISKVWLNEVKCKGDESHLWKCSHPGWGISYYHKATLKKIECSNKIDIRLDGFKCAGAVQYSTDGKTPSGYFCADNSWGQEAANLVCKSLKCGTIKEIRQNQWMVWERFRNSKKMAIKCSGIEDHLWQCTPQETPSCKNPASVICTGHEKLRLIGDKSNVCSGRLEKEEDNKWNPVKNNTTSSHKWCNQMYCGTSANYTQDDNGTQLTCTDKVKVLLMDNKKPSRCYGGVFIEVNNSPKPVCASTWTDKDAQVVCRELSCGSVVSKGTLYKLPGIMDNVECSGNENSLWHCKAKHDNITFPCASNAYVVCADSIKVELKDGPGKCAGRLEIQYEGRWQRVNKEGWTDINSDIVCRQLGCGNNRNSQSNPEKFSQGSGEFLGKTIKCKENANNLSECTVTGKDKKFQETEAVGIVCEEHKVVFLKGDVPCSGMVGIEHGDKVYWLSGSNETWNQKTANTVCRGMNCGEASSHYFHADKTKDIWNQSYSCSSKTTSLFDCENTKLPSDHKESIATVTCSVNITMNLSNGCWGNVNFCVDGECGGTCANTWTEQKSAMLCKNLDCGDTVLRGHNKPEESKVIFKSLHSTKNTANLTQCNFIRNDENDNTCNPAYVVCSGSVESRINSYRDKCSGNVEVRYEGQWLPVCTEALEDVNTQNAICGPKCGQPVKKIDYFGPTSGRGYVISKIQCAANGKESLKACNVDSEDHRCTPGGLQCSGWKKMALTLDKACSGAVFVHSKEGKSAVSIEGWTENEGDRLCQDLKCGKFKSNKTTTSNSPSTTSFSCAGLKNLENIWQCEKQSPSSNKQQLFIECQDEPKVTLSKECHGEVRIDDIEVCATNWKDTNSQMVCQEMNCSNAFEGVSHDKVPSPEKQYYHVSCEDNHYELGQCKRFKAKCNGRLVKVYCVGKVQFNTTEKCGGYIEVKYRDEKWEKVCPLTSFPPKLMDDLCENLDCKRRNASKLTTKTDKLFDLETTLNCVKDCQDLKYCVRKESCKNVKAAEIYCYGHEDITIGPIIPTKFSLVPIIVGVGFLLVLVILIVVLIRICIVKKAKNAINVSSRKLSSKEVEFESGNYDDVMGKTNEMEDLSPGRFRSESEVITENDAQSTSSLPYDDIDVVVEAQPLISQPATDDASGDNYINEGVLNQSTDGVTYEVEDPRENYDDIEASPEITQTEAEVHRSPQTKPESNTEAPLGLVQGDEDYLVPGQDG